MQKNIVEKRNSTSTHKPEAGRRKEAPLTDRAVPLKYAGIDQQEKKKAWQTGENPFFIFFT